MGACCENPRTWRRVSGTLCKVGGSKPSALFKFRERQCRMSAPRTFQLKAGNKWAVTQYKGKLRIVMNRNGFMVRQPVTGRDVLSISQVRSLAAWLNRYLHMVQPTEEFAVLAGMRAQTRGLDRNLEKLESKMSEKDNDGQP